MPSLSNRLLPGLVAGAAGTTALNAATYFDMALRGRPESSTPQQTVEKAAGIVGADIPGSDEPQQHARASGLGALLGIAAGVSAGVALGACRAAGPLQGRAATLTTAWALAMVAGNGPMTVLGVTDPRTWSAKDWAADVVPHLAYAVAAATTLEFIERPRAA
jgi:hypothetical protein